jgi:hypothetical protein
MNISRLFLDMLDLFKLEHRLYSLQRLSMGMRLENIDLDLD